MSATTSFPRIPQELCEKVVACVTVKYEPDKDIDLQDPYSTARQCALVYRAWLPSARSLIFRIVDLSASGAKRLMELLNLNPTLSRYMTTVIIRAPREFNAACLGLVAELAPKLTAVRDLTVRGGTTERPDSREWEFYADAAGIRELQNAILPILHAPTLTTMILKDIPFATTEQLHQFICSPPLVTLILDKIHLSPNSHWLGDAGFGHDGLVQATERTPAISELAVDSQDGALMRWILHRSFPANVPALRELSIRLNDVGNMHEFLPLLNAVGSSLKSFGVRLPCRCDFKEYRHFSRILDAIPTLPNTHIEHLFVSGFDRRDPSIGVYSKHFDGAEFVTSLLLRLPAPQHLQTLNINEDVYISWNRDKAFPKLQWHNWREVDELLARDSFSNVKTLNFFSGLGELHLPREDVRACITPHFHSFQKRKGTVFNLTVEYNNFAWRRERDRRDEWQWDNINSADV